MSNKQHLRPDPRDRDGLRAIRVVEPDAARGRAPPDPAGMRAGVAGGGPAQMERADPVRLVGFGADESRPFGAAAAPVGGRAPGRSDDLPDEGNAAPAVIPSVCGTEDGARRQAPVTAHGCSARLSMSTRIAPLRSDPERSRHAIVRKAEMARGGGTDRPRPSCKGAGSARRRDRRGSRRRRRRWRGPRGGPGGRRHLRSRVPPASAGAAAARIYLRRPGTFAAMRDQPPPSGAPLGARPPRPKRLHRRMLRDRAFRNPSHSGDRR